MQLKANVSLFDAAVVRVRTVADAEHCTATGAALCDPHTQMGAFKKAGENVTVAEAAAANAFNPYSIAWLTVPLLCTEGTI